MSGGSVSFYDKIIFRFRESFMIVMLAHLINFNK